MVNMPKSDWYFVIRIPKSCHSGASAPQPRMKVVTNLPAAAPIRLEVEKNAVVITLFPGFERAIISVELMHDIKAEVIPLNRNATARITFNSGFWGTEINSSTQTNKADKCVPT